MINNRIAGVLAVTRSFGDIEFKTLPAECEVSTDAGTEGSGEGGNSDSQTLGASPVLALPEVVERQIATEDEFLVLGTDGLWDVMGSQEVRMGGFV